MAVKKKKKTESKKTIKPAAKKTAKAIRTSAKPAPTKSVTGSGLRSLQDKKATANQAPKPQPQKKSASASAPKPVATPIPVYPPAVLTLEGVLSTLEPVLRSKAFPVKPANELHHLCTDSRICKKGDVFIALAGQTSHGFDFISTAVKGGAVVVVADRPKPADLAEHVVYVEVEDALLAFRKLSAMWRSQFHIPVFGIAGSVGKTTTKDMLAAILGGRFKSVLKTEGSQNGFTGIPATLARLRKDNKAAVIEIGIDDVGAMAQHLDLVRPDITIVTAIGPEHLERLKNIDTVAVEETLALKRTASSGGVAVVNLDDDHCRPFFGSLKPESRVGFSLYPKLKPRPDVLIGRLSFDGQELEVSGDIRGRRMVREKFSLPLPGKHNAANLLAAIAAAAVAGMIPDEMRSGLADFVPGFGRSRIEQLASGVLVICDYYNASPSSVSAALDLLRERSTVKGRRGKKYACLGDMLELGKEEESMHRRLADKLAAAGVDKVLLFGERMKWLADELKRRKFESDVEHFDSHLLMSDHLRENLRPDDYVLIKGSRGMAMERVWESLQGAD
jgi:UDP-N-acetylmuramoyl-tripeptide--D-alanyl-D-alanine ligase